jgi:hypothetical protein
MKCALPVLLLALGASSALAQTTAMKKSTVGTWTLDVAKSDFGSNPAPKSLTLTILSDTAESTSYQVTVVDPKDQSMSYSWSGPMDGSMHPIKGPNGEELAQESLRVDADGALLRHGVEAEGGASFDGRATLSEDGNTITDVVTRTSKDGQTSKSTNVFVRSK